MFSVCVCVFIVRRSIVPILEGKFWESLDFTSVSIA